MNDLVIADSVKAHYNKIIFQIYEDVLDKFSAIAETSTERRKIFELYPECRDIFLQEIEQLQKILDDHNIDFEGRDSFRARRETVLNFVGDKERKECKIYGLKKKE